MLYFLQNDVDWPLLSLEWPRTETPALDYVDEEEHERQRASKLYYAREIERHPDSVKTWVLYVSQFKDEPMKAFEIYEKAIETNPNSYKLCMLYLREVMNFVSRPATPQSSTSVTPYMEGSSEPSRWSTLHPESIFFKKIEMLMERAVSRFSKMPQMWMLYIHFLLKYRLKISTARQTLNRGLRSLAITQHGLLWDSFIKDYMETIGTNCPLTSISFFRRYVQLRPSHIELFISHLVAVGNYKDAVDHLLVICYDDDFISIEGKSKLQLWIDLCSLISSEPEACEGIDVDGILRCGIRSFPSLVGPLWVALATSYVRLNDIESARDVFEEALDSIATPKDFSTVYDKYVSFLESTVQELMKRASQETGNTKELVEVELDLHMMRLEHLLDSRASLLSTVKLRRNPNNVFEWLNRIKLLCLPHHSRKRPRETGPIASDESKDPSIFDGINFEDIQDPQKVVETFTEAVLTVDDTRATGRIESLWLAFATFYELYGDLENARDVLKRASESTNYRGVESVVRVWRERIEFDVRHSNFSEALTIARDSVSIRVSKAGGDKLEDPTSYLHKQLHRSPHLWGLLCDLEESFGSEETVRAAYERAYSLKVITVNQVFGYANYLQEHNCYEESFHAFEKALHIFKWPHVYDIWLIYLTQFVSRYGKRKIERARELFEEAVKDVLPQFAFRLFFVYAKFEEHYGLIKHCLSILHRGTKKVTPDKIWPMYKLLISKAAVHLGSIKTRSIFEEAVQKVPEPDLVEIASMFVALEVNLMDYPRARAVYDHVSQYCNPSKELKFWANWREFEVRYGNEDTFKEMLRKRRSVQARFAEAAVDLKEQIDAITSNTK